VAKTAEVNGSTFTGPVWIALSSELTGFSITAMGDGDPATIAAGFDGDFDDDDESQDTIDEDEINAMVAELVAQECEFLRQEQLGRRQEIRQRNRGPLGEFRDICRSVTTGNQETTTHVHRT